MRLVCAAILCALVAPVAARSPRPPLRPLTIDPVTWEMNVDETRAVLEGAGMAPKYDETRRYKARQPGDSGPIVHTSEPGFSFTWRKGWRGTLHFGWNAAAKDYRIDRVLVYAEAITDGALKDELAALTSRYGTPAAKKPNEYIWTQGGTRLGAAFTQNADTKRWTLFVSLRPDAP